jgi:uncharacterized protein YfaS (alpha-2-macroglobulin family)
MKSQLVRIGLALVCGFTAASSFASAPGSFEGVTPEPMGKIKQPVSQLRLRFPAEMVKEAKVQPFQVSCSPEAKGFASWADNNTIWTYDFKAKSEYDSPRLVGGTKCQITQTADVKSVDGKVWKAGSIAYDVIVSGPNVTSINPAHGFQGALRDVDPIVLVTFDGPVDSEKFFADQNGYLNYLSSNAPSEKMALTAVPQDQQEQIFKHFKTTGYFDVELNDRNWVLATVKQNLIPGSEVNISIENQVSATNADVKAEEKFAEKFSIRSNFQAEVQCTNSAGKTGSCMPNAPISIQMNGQVKWADIKDAYIEYVPYKSGDSKVVRSFAEIDKEHQYNFWDGILDRLSRYFPFLAKYSDTVLDSVVFNVNIEPQTQAKIVLPADLKDVDGRVLSNAITEFHVRIGAMDEMIQMTQQMSFFEKNVPNLFLPVGVVNLNQKLNIRKSGTDSAKWAPIRDVATMIQLVRGYAARDEYRDQAQYRSPLEELQIPSTVVEEKLTGAKNRTTVLQFPFASKESGLYAIEVSSPTYEAAQSDPTTSHYYNPKHVLAQVTDLTVHLKKGETTNLAWITHLSDAKPAAGAQLEIYNCNGDKVSTLTADASGLVSFPKKQWAADCGAPEDVYSQYFDSEAFYMVAKQGEDIAFVHTSWTSENGYAMGAPGVDYFASNIRENTPNFHAVIAVNLVKPGQSVPVELVAKIPDAQGFREVPANQLPTSARIVSGDDEDTFYEFPLKWKNGKAELLWNVPAESNVRLGRYEIVLGRDDKTEYVRNGDIEVAEFKIPLMSGIIAFPNQDLVQPDSIPVGTVIRYANGVGAKKLNADLSYYFTPDSIESKELAKFEFGTGAVSVNDDSGAATAQVLPNSARPAVIPGLNTGDTGEIKKDIALEKIGDGRSVAEVLKTVGRPQRLVVRLRYQDQVGEFQTLSQAKDIFNSTTYVGSTVTAGSRAEARLQAAVIDTKKKNITNLSDLEFKLVRVETKVIGEELFGGLIKNTLERELKPVRWVPTCSMQDQVASCPVGALKEGSYAFQVTSKTSKQAAHTLFKVDTDGRVYNQNDYYNMGDDEGNKQLPLALNKKEYKDGERAIVSFAAPFKTCQALVTIERSDVMESFIAPNACEKGNVEVSVKASQAPNVYVSVYAITGRATSTPLKPGEMDLGRPTYRIGFANMKVNWNRFKANVSVTTNKAKYEPGEQVEVAVAVQAEEGQLSQGAVTLVALEEKILELKKNDTYGVLESLMQLRYHNVETVTALGHIETVTTGNADIPRSAPARKGGDEGGDGSAKSDFKRKLFNALVAYQPNVPVQNGVAKFSFKANDSLTRFKIFAIMTDAGQKFGTGEAVYLTEKDTQVYSNIPTVAHSGDSYPLKVTVQNNSAKAGKFKAEITVVTKDRNGKVLSTKKLTKEASIDKSGSEAIDVGQMEISEEADRIEYAVNVYDENGKLVDSMQPEPQVVLPSTPLAIHDSFVNQVENGSLSKTLVKDAAALDGKGEIRISTSKSLVSSALTQIGQRIERETFADFFSESRLQIALLRSTDAKPEELKKVFDALSGLLDSEGFVKYYAQATRGSVHLTASILNLLQQEPWTAKHMPAALKEKLKDATSKVLTKSVNPSYIGKTPMDWMRAQSVMGRAAFYFNDQNMSASAVAINKTINEELKRNPLAYGEPMEKWSNADLVERWLLEVYADPQAAKTAAAYKSLMGPARLVHTGNAAKLNGSPYYNSYYSDETIETAKLLFGHAQLKADKNLARNLAVGLATSNVKGWYNVSTMTHAAQALKAFGRGYEMESVTGTALLSVPEMQKSTSVDFGQVASGGLTTEWTTPKATLEVKHAGVGQPWVSVQALSAVPLTNARGQGLSIEKTVRNLTRDSGYQAGDILEVTLNIHANAAIRHVAVLDPIPAGANILSDAYGDFSSGQKSYSGYKLYFESLSNGATTVKFQYQLNNPGTFKMPPTRAEGLYMPSVYAEAPNAKIVVQ